jgi:predicted NBD/HSP70 family sugar kinase
MSDTREHIHQLIDQLPPSELPAVEGLLEALLDDPAILESEARRIAEGEAWFAARGGKGIPMEEVLAEFGLKPGDFPLKP